MAKRIERVKFGATPWAGFQKGDGVRRSKDCVSCGGKTLDQCLCLAPIHPDCMDKHQRARPLRSHQLIPIRT